MNFDAFLAEFSTFLIGVTVVFATLLLLILLIQVLSKMVEVIEAKSKPVAPIATSEEDRPTPVVEETVNLIEELELVAVITAAIAASMETTTDKLQVRSLRKVTRQVR
ncbi:MAG: OadG family transporter subunit [Cellulosilyticaceae bacterium]